jgi:hypothetical protein
VTDLDYVAEWASKHGVAVLRLADDEVPGVVGPPSDNGLARQVQKVFVAPNHELQRSAPGIAGEAE